MGVDNRNMVNLHKKRNIAHAQCAHLFVQIQIPSSSKDEVQPGHGDLRGFTRLLYKEDFVVKLASLPHKARYLGVAAKLKERTPQLSKKIVTYERRRRCKKVLRQIGGARM